MSKRRLCIVLESAISRDDLREIEGKLAAVLDEVLPEAVARIAEPYVEKQNGDTFISINISGEDWVPTCGQTGGNN